MTQDKSDEWPFESECPACEQDEFLHAEVTEGVVEAPLEALLVCEVCGHTWVWQSPKWEPPTDSEIRSAMERIADRREKRDYERIDPEEYTK